MMRDRWQQMQTRERALIVLAGVVLTLVLLWVLLWEPLVKANEQRRTQIVEQQSLLLWLQSIEPDVQQLRANRPQASAPSNRSPIGLIDQTARNAGMAAGLQRIEPAAGNQVRVVLEQVEFSRLMDWLSELTAGQPYRIVQLEAQRSDPGRVDAVVVIDTRAR
ncbi:MAG: type II secretion system protein GspM [Pseudomonadota bacterium]